MRASAKSSLWVERSIYPVSKWDVVWVWVSCLRLADHVRSDEFLLMIQEPCLTPQLCTSDGEAYCAKQVSTGFKCDGTFQRK